MVDSSSEDSDNVVVIGTPRRRVYDAVENIVVLGLPPLPPPRVHEARVNVDLPLPSCLANQAHPNPPRVQEVVVDVDLPIPSRCANQAQAALFRPRPRPSTPLPRQLQRVGTLTKTPTSESSSEQPQTIVPSTKKKVRQVTLSGKKPPDELLRDQFRMEKSLCGTKTKITCKHCAIWVKEHKSWNATKNRAHLLHSCKGVSDSLKFDLDNRSQTGKMRIKLEEMDTSCVHDIERMSDVRAACLHSARLQRVTNLYTKKRKADVPLTDQRMLGAPMSEIEAKRIIKFEVGK